MEVKKIRIGNDIKLKVLLALDGDTAVNINSAEAFFVNSTLKEKFEKDYIKKNRFIGRFPIEPFVDEFEPSEYNIHSTGYHRYRAFVMNQYNGFGWNPDWKKSMPICDINITEYRSSVKRLSPNTIQVEFPAEALLYEGVYELIVVLKIKDAGYSKGERTITMNMNSVFELVKDSDDATDSDVSIEIINKEDTTPSDDVYVISGSYDNNNITLNRNDKGRIDINVTPITGWYVSET